MRKYILTNPCIFPLHNVGPVVPQPAWELEETSIHKLCILSLTCLHFWVVTHSVWLVPVKQILSKVWSGLWEGDQIEEERMNCLELAEEAILVRDNVPRPLSWVESSCLWQNYFYKAREGTGQQGRRSMSGSGKKKSTAGSPVGTNWNRTQLEVTLHAFQMPPWNRFLLYLCKGGTWNNSEITTTPWPRNCDSPEPPCACWGVPHWS